jgi:hypothetical protein
MVITLLHISPAINSDTLVLQQPSAAYTAIVVLQQRDLQRSEGSIASNLVLVLPKREDPATPAP